VGVTRQGFYAWKRRPRVRVSLLTASSASESGLVHAETEGIYGSPRIHAELRLEHGIRVGRKRIARLMRRLELRGADGRRGGLRTTIRDPKRSSAPDLVDRCFARAEPNRLWVCDLEVRQTAKASSSSLPSKMSSARIIGWSMRDDLKAELVLDALGMAISARGNNSAGVVAHSDHGSQHTSVVYGAYAKPVRDRPLVGSIGDPWDKPSPRRSSPASRKNSSDASDSRPASTPECASSGTSNASTNPRRRHSSLDYLSPTEYEQRHQQEAIAA